MIPENFVGNPDLEAEYLASQILDGLILPAAYTSLRIEVAGIPLVDASDKLSEKLLELQDEVVSKFGLLDDKPLKDFYFGENSELKTLIKAILKETSKQEELYSLAAGEQLEKTASMIEQQAATMDYYNLAEGVNQAGIENEKIHQYNETYIKLKKMAGALGAILQSYGAGEEKLPTKKVVTAGLNPKYKIFLNDLSQNVTEVADHMKLSFTLGKALDGIISLIPKDDLDPYLSDVCSNYIEVVTNPKAFYSMCQKDEIISSSVGQLFANSYPEFYSKYQDMYMDGYEEMDYQQQIDFRKCFGLDSDDSDLVGLCSQYVKLGFAQQ